MTSRRTVVAQWERLGLTAIVLGLFIWPACGQPGAKTPPNRVAVHAGRMLDVRAGRWLADQNIFIEGDKIARIELGPAQLVPGWTQIDLGNAAVLPGLIDCHVHLTLSPSSFGYELLGVSEARQTAACGQEQRLPCVSKRRQGCLRHGCWRVSARAQCPRVQFHGARGTFAPGRDPGGNNQCRGSSRMEREGRSHRTWEVGGSRGG